MERLQCLFIGYLFGNFLTAKLIVWFKLKKQVEEIGSGNPGMANVMNILGFKCGILVLLGDLLKTFFACLICAFFFRDLGRIVILYAGLGAVLGHNYPIMNKLHGGKGVTATCAAMICYAPLWGLLSVLAGLVVVIVSGYLGLSAVVIALAFLCFGMAAFPIEGIWLAFILAVLMILKHSLSLCKIMDGTEEKMDILGKILSILKKKLHPM